MQRRTTLVKLTARHTADDVGRSLPFATSGVQDIDAFTQQQQSTRASGFRYLEQRGLACRKEM